MPKPYPLELVLKILQLQGFEYVSQRSSHIKFRKSGHDVLTVIVPTGRKEIPYGTFKSILRQSELAEKDFKK